MDSWRSRLPRRDLSSLPWGVRPLRWRVGPRVAKVLVRPSCRMTSPIAKPLPGSALARLRPSEQDWSRRLVVPDWLACD